MIYGFIIALLVHAALTCASMESTGAYRGSQAASAAAVVHVPPHVSTVDLLHGLYEFGSPDILETGVEGVMFFAEQYNTNECQPDAKTWELTLPLPLLRRMLVALRAGRRVAVSFLGNKPMGFRVRLQRDGSHVISDCIFYDMLNGRDATQRVVDALAGAPDPPNNDDNNNEKEQLAECDEEEDPVVRSAIDTGSAALADFNFGAEAGPQQLRPRAPADLN
jgi:hypothetical protein